MSAVDTKACTFHEPVMGKINDTLHRRFMLGKRETQGEQQRGMSSSDGWLYAGLIYTTGNSVNSI